MAKVNFPHCLPQLLTLHLLANHSVFLLITCAIQMSARKTILAKLYYSSVPLNHLNNSKFAFGEGGLLRRFRQQCARRTKLSWYRDSFIISIWRVRTRVCGWLRVDTDYLPRTRRPRRSAPFSCNLPRRANSDCSIVRERSYYRPLSLISTLQPLLLFHNLPPVFQTPPVIPSLPLSTHSNKTCPSSMEAQPSFKT